MIDHLGTVNEPLFLGGRGVATSVTGGAVETEENALLSNKVVYINVNIMSLC